MNIILGFKHFHDAYIIIYNGKTMDFREMRRRRQQLSDEESIAILRNGTSGTLGLLGDNGYPYTVPLSYVYADGCIYFHSALAGHKVDAIRACDKASFCVVAQDAVQPKEYTTYFRSVIAFGRIHIIDDEQEKLKTAACLAIGIIPAMMKACRKNWKKVCRACRCSVSTSSI